MSPKKHWTNHFGQSHFVSLSFFVWKWILFMPIQTRFCYLDNNVQSLCLFFTEVKRAIVLISKYDLPFLSIKLTLSKSTYLALLKNFLALNLWLCPFSKTSKTRQLKKAYILPVDNTLQKVVNKDESELPLILFPQTQFKENWPNAPLLLIFSLYTTTCSLKRPNKDYLYQWNGSFYLHVSHF